LGGQYAALSVDFAILEPVGSIPLTTSCAFLQEFRENDHLPVTPKKFDSHFQLHHGMRA